MDKDSDTEGSSPDTVIARSSLFNDEEKFNDSFSLDESTTGNEFTFNLDTSNSAIVDESIVATGKPDSSASVQPVVGVNEERKKGRFRVLKHTLRKESSNLFKNIKKNKSVESVSSTEINVIDDEITKESTKTNIRLLDETERSEEPVLSPATSSGLKSPPITKMMKKKKSGNSLVRKLSLNKFRFGSSDQETRHTPEGDESSRSPSQSSQESPGNNDSPIRNLQKVNQHQREQQLNEKLVNTKEKKSREKKVTTPVVTSTLDRRNPTSTWGHDKEKGAATTMSERRIDEQHRQLQQKQLEKTPSTVTVIQRKSPSVTIKTSFTGNNKGSLELKRDDSSGTLGTVSTLPYALSKWPEKNFDTKTSVQFKKTKLSVKSESESSLTRNLSVKTSPVEVRRKLSLLDEKRAIFQRKYFKSSEEEEDLSRDTVIHAATESLDKFVELTDGKKTKNNSSDLKSSRPISVKTFDTFDEQSLDYLDDIDERFSSLEIQNDVFSTTNTKRDSIAVMGETSEVPRRLSADSGVRF
ncbi:hypothetical protein PV326_007990 [Microctonus aethiopoides]|nr:hypothetical protein PV326_007990 [Microctonus aethiopoides]